MTDWHPIELATGEVRKMIDRAQPPVVGTHIGRCATLPDGRWLIIKFNNPSGEPEAYFILPPP
jgi:hypothetical protein